MAWPTINLIVHINLFKGNFSSHEYLYSRFKWSQNFISQRDLILLGFKSSLLEFEKQLYLGFKINRLS